jgi:hypothetical protein
MRVEKAFFISRVFRTGNANPTSLTSPYVLRQGDKLSVQE